MTNTFEFTIDNYFDLSKGALKEKHTPYKQYCHLKKIKLSRWSLLKNVLSFVLTKLFLEFFFFELSVGTSLKNIYLKTLEFARVRGQIKVQLQNQSYDIFHFHFCTPSNLIPLFFLPSGSKSICSFWGSDLMRFTGVRNVFYVKKALDKATSITLQTPEMAEMLYCKYGRELQKKTTTLRFTINTEIFKNIDKLKNDDEQLKLFRNTYGIANDKIKIALGHNAFEENNHLKMITEIKKIPELVLNNVVFILHMSYGGSESYLKKIESIKEKEKKLDIVIITAYLNPYEMALLRLNTDVLVQMPVSDALSGAMTEVLYAGNIVIAGAWLPYGILRRNNIVYQEIETFVELSEKLAKSIKNSVDLKSNNVDNNENIRSFLFPDVTTKDWISLFNSVNDQK